MVAVIEVVAVVAKVLVWAAAVVNMVVAVEVLTIDVRSDVVIEMLSGVEINVVAAAVTALEFALPISYFVDVLSCVVVGAFVDALAVASMMTNLESAVPKL